jgi:hypothetical protein
LDISFSFKVAAGGALNCCEVELAMAVDLD